MRVKASTRRGSSVRFGQFELDLSEERLFKKGLPVRIENQPYLILAALLEDPGEVVSREQLCSSLWPDGTYVDFDEGLNTAVKKLRSALGDSAENPVFIETVPRRGYRFIAPVATEGNGSGPLETVPQIHGDRLSSLEGPRAESLVLTRAGSQPRRKLSWLIALGVVFVGGCGLFYRLAVPPPLRITQITRLTTSGRHDPWGRLASDGSRVFFLERQGDHWNSRQISVAGGESIPFGPSGRNLRVLAVSTDQSEMLFSPFTSRTPDLPLWSMPLVGGAPSRVGHILVNGAAFSPDGTRIAFTNSAGVFVANHDGSAVRQLAAMPDCWDIAWSPDGKTLRFGQDGPHLWQVSPTGGDLHSFLPAWSSSDGNWTADGAYYIFSASNEGQKSIWALRELPSFPWLRPKPARLTSSPINLAGPLPSRDGRFIFVHGGLVEQFDVVRFDPATHQFKPLLPGVNIMEAAFSPDHQWVFYNNWKQIWCSRPDGSDRRQLATASSFPISDAHWSPDSKHILFESVDPVGKGAIYLVSTDGGPPQQPLPPGPSRRGPTLSPDGKTITFSIEEVAGETSPLKQGIYLFDLAQGHTTLIPGSSGLAAARWSPDGRFLAAVSVDGTYVKVLDLKTHQWTEVGRGTAIVFPVWSADSVLYFQDLLVPGEPVYRVRPGVSPQRVYSFEDILQADASAMRCRFEGFAPDGSLLVEVSLGGGDVYSLTVGPR